MLKRSHEVFYKADLTKDYKFSAADGAAWEKYGAFDIDADGQVSFDEFVAKAELPYPQWDGEVKRNVVYKRVGDETLLLHIHGDQDVVISPNHACHLKQHAEAVDAPVDVAMVKGAGHGWWAADIDPDRKTVEQMTVAFALKHAGEGR